MKVRANTSGIIIFGYLIKKKYDYRIFKLTLYNLGLI